MNESTDAHIRRLDLTLLLTFDLLLRRRNMSQVATDLGVTQSAVSHAVARLRGIFDDPLFVRKGAGVEPTPRSLLLGPMLGAALNDVRAALTVGRGFDPAASTRQFGLAAPDTVIAALAPRLLRDLARTAPRGRIVFRMLPPNQAAAAVAAGEVDLAVGSALDSPRDTVGRPIASETFGVVARTGHIRLRHGLDLDTYCGLDHLLVSHDRDARGVVDVILGGLGRERRLVAILPHLMLAFAAVSQSDAVITAPLRACRYAATLFPVTILEPPIAIPALDLVLLRHRNNLADPAIDWFDRMVGAALEVHGETDG